NSFDAAALRQSTRALLSLVFQEPDPADDIEILQRHLCAIEASAAALAAAAARGDQVPISACANLSNLDELQAVLDTVQHAISSALRSGDLARAALHAVPEII